MATRIALGQYLRNSRRTASIEEGQLIRLIEDVAYSSRILAAMVGHGALGEVLGAAGSHNVQGEEQQQLDILANDVVLETIRRSRHARAMISEEMDSVAEVEEARGYGRLLLLIDPLDGSGNIDINLPIGTIFSILEAPMASQSILEQHVLQPGRRQLAAGYVLYGPSVVLVLTVGQGVAMFTLNRQVGEYLLVADKLQIPKGRCEYAINSANERFWDDGVRRYIAECQAGKDGPLGADYSMRWTGAMVGDCHRVLLRGGIFMYPVDARTAAKGGKLRLLYEANPMAFLMEQAGGAASDGQRAILDIQPSSLHQRVGVALGDAEEVARLVGYATDTAP